MQYSNSILFGLAFWPLVGAHMFMANPPALKSISNKNTVSPDYSLTSPLMADGSDYPCKGYHKLLGTPEGAAVASWAAGSSQHFTLQGGASHSGGSCQASLSFDGGKSFKVVKSFIGDCPAANGGDFSFTVPTHVPSNATALFAWTWFNQVGNREMYMDCATVSITNGTGSNLDGLPELFKANIGNGCTTADNADVVFPSPGSDVVNISQKPAPPQGICQQATPGGGQSLSNASSSVGTINFSSSAALFPNSTTLANKATGTGAALNGPLGVVPTKLSTLQSKNMTSTSSASGLVSTFVLTQTITTTQIAPLSTSLHSNQTTSLHSNQTATSTAAEPAKSSTRTNSSALSASQSTSLKASSSAPLVIIPLIPSGTLQSSKIVTLTTPSVTPSSSKVVTLTTPSATPSSSKVVTLTTPSATPSSSKVVTLTTPSATPSSSKVVTLTTPSATTSNPKLVTLATPPGTAGIIKPITPSAVTQSPKVVTLTTPSGTPDVIKPITPSALKDSSSQKPATLVTSTKADAFPSPHKSDAPTPKPSTPATSEAPAKTSSSSYNPYPYPKNHSRRRRQYTKQV
ncbi:MAG: hypothetical protein M1812_006855 [Candelaria pacifica]|nr:MAG: hypothetical protein M1812_006855 [Candelaria pacifica]